MTLERFFSEGNKMGVVGSFIYLPESASDLDFTLFTIGGRSHFSPAPEYSPEIIEFLKSQFGEINLELDFIGRGDKIGRAPYDISNLPKDDLRLDGYLLSGVFSPDNNFLNEHYRNIFGEDFLMKSWLRYSGYVQGFPLQEARLNQRHKDIALLLKATERLADDRHPEFKKMIEEYRDLYNELNELYRTRNINVIDYNRRTADMVPKFVSAVNSLPLSK